MTVLGHDMAGDVKKYSELSSVGDIFQRKINSKRFINIFVLAEIFLVAWRFLNYISLIYVLINLSNLFPFGSHPQLKQF